MLKTLLYKNLIICCCLMLSAANIVRACSGEFAGDFIRENEFTARIYAVIGVIIVLTTIIFYFLRDKKGLALVIISIMILALHPGWTRGAWVGDCGTSIVIWSKYFTAFLGFGVVIQLLLYFCTRKKNLS